LHHGEQVFGEAHDPAQRKQQQQARHHGKAKAQPTRFVAQFGRESSDQNGNEDDVVDAQHNFQCGEHRESDPEIGVK
jgi:hypothetical protein